MSSLGNASVSQELIENIVTASGKEYNRGSNYEVEFRGPGVKIVEYDEHGVLVSSEIYKPIDESKVDWSEEIKVIEEVQMRNRFKKIIYYTFLIITGFLVTLAFGILKYLK